ncbi:MAG: protease B [Microscillaceae bacterium]|nr:protease B [Microscillaceae bacterium]
MKYLNKFLLGLAICALFLASACQNQKEEIVADDVVSPEVLQTLHTMGFSTDRVLKTEGGYIVENDIFIPTERLGEVPTHSFWLRDGDEEQYRTTNVVNTNGNRTITVYIQIGGSGGFSTTYGSALDEAIARFNAENLDLSFERVTFSTGANIRFSRLSRRDENRGVLGSAGFPSNGNPFNQIRMSGILESTFGLSVNGIATIMAHEMGHCIGFRHTDYFDRSISCGGGTSNEGAGTVGAINIPGTPTGASLSAQSWMLACTDGSNRPFNNDDKTALAWMYVNNF